jgi:hypothetical protein
MGVKYNPGVVTGGLTFAYDESNPKSGIDYDLIANRYRAETATSEARWNRDSLLDTMYSAAANKDSTAPSPGTGFTVNIWTKRTSATQTSWNPIVVFENTRRMLWLGYTINNAQSIHMSLPYYDATNTFVYWNIDPSFSGTGQTLTVGEWNNIVCTYTNSSRVARGYINTIQGASGTRPGTGDLVLPSDSSSSSPPLRIYGRNDDSTYNHIIGYVSCYNRALNDAEIAQNFDALRGRFSR